YGDVNLKHLDDSAEIPIYSDSLHTIDIENAIKDGRVSANYQPWVGMHSSEQRDLREIYDVRIELFDVRGFVISQNMLLKLMDDAYAKRSIDRWVLKTAASKLLELHETKADNNIKLAVKITISSLAEESFIPWLRELLTEIDLPNDYLLLEIDAGQFVRNPSVFNMLFDTVGVEFKIKFILSGIHDLNLYQLARDQYRFEYVKLNISLLVGGGNRWHLNKFIADIRSSDVNIVAINISDAAKLSLATEYNVDFMHGYLIGKPVKDIITDDRGDFYCVI
ncbi:MAG: EAL domain-containing protein, partial [Gammaproteobacteria bacterium]